MKKQAPFIVKFIAYPLSLVFFIFFGLTLVVFHPIQWFCFNILGYEAHKVSVVWLQFLLMRCTNLLGVRYHFENPYTLEPDRPTIIVANHQSMYDIPPILWFFRNQHPKFISKKELGNGIPSVSYNLRHGGSVLIDRKNPVQSIKAIEDFGQRIKDNNWAAVIFPEGTRSRNGKPRSFKIKGLQSLMTQIPEAQIVPLTINNSWKMLRYGQFPMGLGAKINFRVHKPQTVSDNLLSQINEIEFSASWYQHKATGYFVCSIPMEYRNKFDFGLK